MEDDKIVAVCPRCQKGTVVKSGGDSTRIIKCSNKECQFKGSLMKFRIRHLRDEVAPQSPVHNQSCPTDIASVNYPAFGQSGCSIPADGGTMIKNYPTQKNALPAIGYLQVATGEKYSLKVGSNIVGRQHPTSQATLQILTNDGYMSRQHMKIDVIPNSNGRMEYQINDNNSKNQTSINGQILAQGDIVFLKPGDKITIGHTDLIFKIV